ncbi:MAG: glycosyltransferase family 2 protein [Candidatus Marinimicrobia bacterium]|nr:glycosyltransferase family 2 protein [Candidatus Neomarinimicrobiota bacterium]
MVKKEIVKEADPSLQLSILIVSYNSVETIKSCIESLVDELILVSGEIIVVDNASIDDTPSLLKALATEHKQVQIQLNHSNRGFAVGNNQALELAKGKHVLILNPDTIIQQGSIKGLLQELESDERIGLVAPQLQFPDGRIQKSCRRFPTHMDVIYHSLGLSQLFPESKRFNGWKMGDFDHQTKCQVDQPAGAALLINGDILRQLNGFDPNFPMFFNDVDLCKRVKNLGCEIWYLPEFVVVHLGGASVKQAKIKMTVSSHVSFFRYFEKHFTRLHQQPLNFIIGLLLYLSLIPRILMISLFKRGINRSRDTL